MTYDSTSLAMIKNYIITAFRNLVRNPVYTLINTFGLSIGITCSILIMIFINHELSYDRFNRKADDLYRMVFEMVEQNTSIKTPQMTAPVAPAMQEEFPEVINVTRLSTNREGFFSYQNRNHHIRNLLYTDSSFFDMFSYDLIQGDQESVMREPYSVVLCEETARKIFGDQNPVGEIIRWNNRDDLMVTGVVKQPPANSHLQFSSLVSFSSLYDDKRLYMDWNGGMQYYHYVELVSGFPKEEIEAKLPDFMYRHINYLYEQHGWSIHALLQPIKKIHLGSHFLGEMAVVGNKSNLFVFSAIALFILIVACINFMNLTTARSTKRAKEVGVRKVVGAGRKKLIRQFLGETIILSVIALVFALILIEIILPVFNQLINRNLELYIVDNLGLIIGIPILIILVGTMAGSYPAFFLSAFNPVKVMKGIFTNEQGRKRFRDVLVLVQFVISIALIICTLVIYTQLSYIRASDVGYAKENVLVLKLTSDGFRSKFQILKEELSKLPEVVSSSAASDFPGHHWTMNGYVPEGFKDPIMIHKLAVDYDFIKTLGLIVIQGREFSPEFATDRQAYMINENLARQLNWENPVGKTINRNVDHMIIGVVRDFHFSSFHEKIGPLIFDMNPYMGYDYLLVRFRTNNLTRLILDIGETWKGIDADEPFEYHLLDDALDNAYISEKKMGEALMYFAFLAIVIASMGLFGLTMYNTEQRTKEIGIRKVFGSSVSRIIFLLSGDFTQWVVIANLFAWPIAFYLMNKWVQHFAYRISMPVWIFILTAVGALLIALLTVSIQSLKAAITNPAEALRYE